MKFYLAFLFKAKINIAYDSDVVKQAIALFFLFLFYQIVFFCHCAT